MTVPTREDIMAAAARISGHIRRTPVIEADAGLAEHLVFKLDTLQPTGTFKIRGAYNRLLSEEALPDKVVAASGGNFARAIAHAARSLGVEAHLFVPDTSPKEKIEPLRDYGAMVHLVPGMYPEALAASVEYAEREGGLFAHAYDQPEMVAGAGTLGMELDTQVPGADTVLVAVGGGGLIAGVASWFRGAVKVVGVETDGTGSLHAAFEAGGPVDVELSGIAISSLGSRRVGEIPWEAARQWVSGSMLVSDDDIVRAQQHLWDHLRVVVEAGSAAPMAALLSGAYRPEPGERVVVVLCGANAHWAP
ncbi:MAG TPA: threonine/serine dehydratase [Acidimicrobiia bacterium]